MSDTNTLKQEPLTEDEIRERKEQLARFYEESLPMMRLQAEYESLKATIEKSRFDVARIQVAYAEMNAPQPKGHKPETSKKPS